MVSALRASPLDGGLMQVWLRRLTEDGPSAVQPLIGIRSDSELTRHDDGLSYCGTVWGIDYALRLRLVEEGLWTWTLALEGEGETVDVLYGQDLGMADEGAVLNNELYMAQYLGHTVFDGPDGWIVCSRQNQGTSAGHPVLQQGMLGARAQHYSTYAMQFHGLGVRFGEAPAALGAARLEDRNYQYELPYIALQSEPLVLSGRRELSVYACFTPQVEDAVRAPIQPADIAEAGPAADDGEAVAWHESLGPAYVSPPFDEATLDLLFPERELEEREEGELLAFFLPDHRHVVLQAKERLVERPHAMIHITSLEPERALEPPLTVTTHMGGAYMSHVALGNTSFHKLLSVVRSPLDLQTHSGLRLYIEVDGRYRRLATPAAYEMGRHFSRWHYLLPDDRLAVTTYTSADRPRVDLEVESASGRAYALRLTAQLLLGEHEWLAPVAVERRGATLLIDQPAMPLVAEQRPGLAYVMQLPEGARLRDDGLFFADGALRNPSLLTVELGRAARQRVAITGYLDGASRLELRPRPAPRGRRGHRGPRRPQRRARALWRARDGHMPHRARRGAPARAPASGDGPRTRSGRRQPLPRARPVAAARRGRGGDRDSSDRRRGLMPI